MRIYRERIPAISTSVVKALAAAELIEVEPDLVPEVELDVGSVLKEYRRVDYELSERAKDLVASRGLDYSHTRKLKSKLAAEKKFGQGEDAIEWLVEYVGRAIVALAADPGIASKTGGVYRVGDLAESYGFVDADGRQVPAFDIPELERR